MLAPLAGVITDVDDTLTRDGEIDPPALAALTDLQARGWPVIAVTGRGAGWGLVALATWPLTALVAENGAVLLRRAGGLIETGPTTAQAAHAAHATRAAPTSDAGSDPHRADGCGPPLTVEFADSAAARAGHRARLEDARRRIAAEVAHARPARDSATRITDLAIDHSEHAALTPDEVRRVRDAMHDAGLTHVTVSSIHVNGWAGDHDKASGARWAIARLGGGALDPSRWLAIGDSANDEALFGALPATSVGVANVARWLPGMSNQPAWITTGDRGFGVAEVARALPRHPAR